WRLYANFYNLLNFLPKQITTSNVIHYHYFLHISIVYEINPPYNIIILKNMNLYKYNNDKLIFVEDSF
ncbi:hypothetical protein ACJX0J_012527, partial [Zea mays]